MSDALECGHIGDRWVCVKPRGHAGMHAHELRRAPPESPGTWPQVCVQRAFVDGAMWWQFHAGGSTPFPSERDEAEEEAVRRYGDPDEEKT